MKTTILIVLLSLLCAGCASAGSVGKALQVCIVTDDGRELPTYPVRGGRNVRKAYAEALKGEQYRIRVRNRLNRRVGVVIAVDGRNIISGGKSWLGKGERMYILEPYGSGEFSGWRTGQDRVNRFYFTDLPDSYAAAFGDESAMGLIAVAAYPERQRKPLSLVRPRTTNRFGSSSDSASAAAPSPSMESGTASRVEKSMESAGTGYGGEEYSPSYSVEFEPQARPVEKILVKYEWRSTLCRMGIASCREQRSNRLWDDGYAPPPPAR